MFDRFETAWPMTTVNDADRSPWQQDELNSVRGYAQLASQFAGCTFDGGLYRIHNATSGPVGVEVLEAAFPAYARRAVPFAFDWLGRQFAVHLGRDATQEPQILLFEPGTGEVLEIPCDLLELHEHELIDYSDAALARTFFDDWRQSEMGSGDLRFDQCVGYKVPLFLGGRDAVGNLEVIDWNVYWTICAQLRAGTANLPPGATIRRVSGP